MYIIIGIAIFIIAHVCGTLTSDIAVIKGWKKNKWYWRGVFFGPLALIAAVGLPIKNQSNS